MKMQYMCFILNACFVCASLVHTGSDIPFYGDLHTQWYVQERLAPDPDALSVYWRYADEAPGGILEPMCGAGRYLIPFAQAGYDIEGCDGSSSMLTACYTACANAGVAPYVWHEQLHNLQRDRTYGLIFITGGSFGFLTDDATVAQALDRIYNHLDPGGICILSAETPRVAHVAEHEPKHVWKGNVMTRHDGTRLIRSQLHFPLENNILPIMVCHEIEQGGDVVRTEIEHIALRTYEPDEMYTKLRNAGFTWVDVCKACDPERAPDAEDTRIMYVCKKGE